MALMDLLVEVAAEQRGFVTPADAEAVGVNPVELRKMAARGRLERVAHGVYRLAAFPHRQNDELMVAVLWTGKRGVIGGQTALALYELCDVNPRLIDVVVPVGYRPRKAGGERYRVHHSRLGPREVDIVDDIPVVVPEVAIAQAIAAHIDPRLIEQAIATARRRDLLLLGGHVDGSVRDNGVTTTRGGEVTDATEHGLAEWPFDPEAVWRNRTTDELFANVQPWTGEESFVIEDLTDEESEAFWAAVNE